MPLYCPRVDISRREIEAKVIKKCHIRNEIRDMAFKKFLEILRNAFERMRSKE